MQVDPPPEEAPIFEPFVELSALAMATSRARLGHLVLAAAYRPAGLTAKMIATLDVVSGGRVELGIGGGWKRDEWESYGYGFPAASERLAILADHLEIITRMFVPGPVTLRGTARLDARRPARAGRPPATADPDPHRRQRTERHVASRRPLRRRAEPRRAAAGRGRAGAARHPLTLRGDRARPGTLRVSVHIWGAADAPAGAARRDRLRAYADLGLDRAIVQGFAAVKDPGHLDRMAGDVAAAGLLGDPAAA